MDVAPSNSPAPLGRTSPFKREWYSTDYAAPATKMDMYRTHRVSERVVNGESEDWRPGPRFAAPGGRVLSVPGCDGLGDEVGGQPYRPDFGMSAGGGRVSKGDDIDSGGREETGEKRTRTGKENRYGKQTGKRRGTGWKVASHAQGRPRSAAAVAKTRPPARHVHYGQTRQGRSQVTRDLEPSTMEEKGGRRQGWKA
ncbi:hypothetical protein K438DRAFT_1944261 [Mycena galopus ATCC 62051]|nr:hypothetical protein K438DRAFT_1944261 [Mycena galopus ATCC 62051]